MADGQTTTLNKANNTSESLRTTVPTWIIRQFELKEGDGLGWRIENDTVVVRPRKKRKE